MLQKRKNNSYLLANFYQSILRNHYNITYKHKFWVIEMLLGKRVKDLRKSKGMTQQELGDLINVTKVSICCYENGTRMPTIDTLLELGKVFGVSIDYFLGHDKVVNNDDHDSYFYLADEEIKILEELRKHEALYDKLIEDPKRTVELIDKKVR